MTLNILTWPAGEFTLSTKFSLCSLCNVRNYLFIKVSAKRAQKGLVLQAVITLVYGLVTAHCSIGVKGHVVSHHIPILVKFNGRYLPGNARHVRHPHFLYTPDTRHQSEGIRRWQEAVKEITNWNRIYITCVGYAWSIWDECYCV